MDKEAFLEAYDTGDSETRASMSADLGKLLEQTNLQVSEEKAKFKAYYDASVEAGLAFARKLQDANLQVGEREGERNKALDACERLGIEREQLRDEIKQKNLQVNTMRDALKEVYKREGPGLDGSSENASGRIARLALEQEEHPTSASAEPERCGSFANYRLDFMSQRGPDHAFACEGHLGKILLDVVKVSRGSAARVSGLPGSSEEPCELGVE